MGLGAHLLAVQMFVLQSLLAMQILLMSQAAHDIPPQSTSVSVPFLTLSPQPAGWQTEFVQTLFTQSDATPHPLKSAHFFGQVLPQSTSVSKPF